LSGELLCTYAHLLAQYQQTVSTLKAVRKLDQSLHAERDKAKQQSNQLQAQLDTLLKQVERHSCYQKEANKVIFKKLPLETIHEEAPNFFTKHESNTPMAMPPTVIPPPSMPLLTLQEWEQRLETHQHDLLR